MQRYLNRLPLMARPIKISFETFGYADGAVLLEMGNTKVLVTVSLSNQIPHFLKNKRQWWLTASYALLPHATHARSERETVQKRSDRSIEISRLIGRSLRSIVKLEQKNSEKTVHVDCDVLQADGGTRVACVTAASIALLIAQKKWLATQEIKDTIIDDIIVGISAGLVKNNLCVDLDYAEDSIADADMNFIFTRTGDIIEVQGCAEKKPLAWQTFVMLRDYAYQAAQYIFSQIDQKYQYHDIPAQAHISQRITSV